ncbi:MAG TPA: MobF family relaxase, partial [Acidimicrobiales bacterium]|nr:MobF family relaxase [Acidimicrobiales bacterium]
MAPDGWEYYATEIAAGGEDYFVGHGEENGCWIGRGAACLGLLGEVESVGLARLFGAGCDPVSGEPLGRLVAPERRSVAGFALSFSPPKSVSILWGLGPDETAAEVRAGHDAAVLAAVEFLQDHAGFCRRGHAGIVQEATSGYVAAAFVHRTSRTLDPQLHTHVLVANRVQAVSDG